MKAIWLVEQELAEKIEEMQRKAIKRNLIGHHMPSKSDIIAILRMKGRSIYERSSKDRKYSSTSRQP